jgi:hypothetical protein
MKDFELSARGAVEKGVRESQGFARFHAARMITDTNQCWKGKEQLRAPREGRNPRRRRVRHKVVGSSAFGHEAPSVCFDGDTRLEHRTRENGAVQIENGARRRRLSDTGCEWLAAFTSFSSSRGGGKSTVREC